MKRWIVFVLVAVALLIVLSPGILGLLAERNVEQGIAARRQQSPELTISTERFERGWFRSVGRHRIELSDRDAFPTLANFVDASNYGSMPALIVTSRLDHGLLPVLSISSMAHDDGSLVPGLGRLVSTLQFDPGDGALVDLPTTISSRIGLTGHTRGRFRMAPGSWADRQGSLHWGDADIAFSIDPQGRLAGATGSIARVQLAAGDETLAIGPLSLHVDRAPTRYGFMTGTVEFASDSIATGDAEISGFRVDAASALQGDTVQGSLLLEIGRAAAPAFGQAGLSMSLRYRGLDAASVAALRAAVRQGLAQEGIAGMLAALSPDATPQLQLLLAAGGHLDIDRLVIGLPQGDITAGAQLTVAAGDGDDFSWPGALLRTTASMSLRVPVATYRAIVAAEPQANAALAAGFLARDGNDYTMQIEVANGMARVNGAPVPLAALLQGR